MTFLDRFGGQQDEDLDQKNASLVQAMHEVANDDSPDTRNKLYEALLASMLLVPVPEIPDGMTPGMHTLHAGVRLSLPAIVDTNKIKTAPAFTDLEALRNWDPNTTYIRLRAVDLFRALLGTDIEDLVINPFDPKRKMIRPGGRVKRWEMEQLAKGATPSAGSPQQIPMRAGEKVLIGLPADRPDAAILETLRTKAADMPSVADMYFFQMARGNQSGTVIGIGLTHETTNQEKQRIVQDLAAAIRTELKPGRAPDFMFLQGAFGEHIRKLGGLIYSKP